MSGETTPRKVLWMVEYAIGQQHHLEPVYAVSQEDAERQGRLLVEQRPEHAEFIGVRAYPRGFIVKYGRFSGSLPEYDDPAEGNV